MPHDRGALLGTLAALVAAALFGTLGPLSRLGEEAGVGGVAFAAWRAALGAVFLALLIGVRGRAGAAVASLRALTPRGRASLATASLMGVLLNVCILSAFGLVPIALALMLLYLYPAGVVVADLALGRERLSGARVAALALSCAGVALVLLGGAGAGTGASLNPLGVALALAAAACQVVFVTVSRGGYSTVPADVAILVVLVTSLVGGTGIGLVAGEADGLTAPFRGPEPWLPLVVGGVAAAGVSSMLFLTAIRVIGGTRTGILMLFEPVVGVLLAALLLGEGLLPVQLAGCGLVLAGSLVLQVGPRPRSSESRQPTPDPSPEAATPPR